MYLFDIFKTDFTDGSVLNKYPHLEYYMNKDRDLFNDSFLACYETLKDRNFDEESTIKYFTTVLINNFKKGKKKKTIKFEDIYAVDESDICDPDKHSETECEIYDIINEKVEQKFGETNHLVWKLHFIDNKSYDDLIKMGYTNINFHNLFRQINSYIKTKLPKEDEYLYELLNKTFSF